MVTHNRSVWVLALASIGREGKVNEMRKKAILVGLALLGLTLVWTHMAVAKPAQEGAFLVDFAETPAQVADQVAGNRLVALRYAKHFQTEPASVLVYFRSELSLTRLEQTTEMAVYHIGPSQRIVSETREFKAGTKVFASKGTIPVLEYGTGNPLTAILPVRKGVSPPAAAVLGSMSEHGDKLGIPNESGAVASETSEVIASATDIPVVPPLTSTLPGSPEVLPPAPSAGDTGSGGPSLSKWLLPVGIAGAAAAMSGGGGSGSGSGDGGTSREPPAVPEPVGIAVLGCSLLTMAGLIRHRRRRQ